MSASTSNNASSLEDEWFVDSGTSNHTMSQQEEFRELRESEWPDHVETGDDTTHPIQHIRNVLYEKEVHQTYIKNVLNVPTIWKNLVSVGDIVERWARMQVQFNQGGCFIENEGQLIACGRREGRMFILDLHKMKSAMFAKGTKADTDIVL